MNYTGLRVVTAWFGWSVAFFVAAALQFYSIDTFRMYDLRIWGNQAHYLQTGDPRQFDGAAAYGHPGGTLIIGTTLIKNVADVSYEEALTLFLALADALVIVLICRISFALRRNGWWVAAIFSFLTLNPLYTESTPPSSLASLLVVLLAALSLLFLYERKALVGWRHAALWGLVAGCACATRIDSGALASLIFGTLLLRHLGIRFALLAATSAALVFTTLDPFMWFMPLQHLYDMIVKVYLHMAVISLEHPPLSYLLTQMGFALLGGLFGLLYLGVPGLRSFIPRAFLVALLVLSALVIAVYANAHNQGVRYLQPLAFLWEWLLPLLIAHLVQQLHGPLKRPAYVGTLGLLCTYPILIFFIHAW